MASAWAPPPSCISSCRISVLFMSFTYSTQQGLFYSMGLLDDYAFMQDEHPFMEPGQPLFPKTGLILQAVFRMELFNSPVGFEQRFHFLCINGKGRSMHLFLG